MTIHKENVPRTIAIRERDRTVEMEIETGIKTIEETVSIIMNVIREKDQTVETGIETEIETIEEIVIITTVIRMTGEIVVVTIPRDVLTVCCTAH